MLSCQNAVDAARLRWTFLWKFGIYGMLKYLTPHTYCFLVQGRQFSAQIVQVLYPPDEIATGPIFCVCVYTRVCKIVGDRSLTAGTFKGKSATDRLRQNKPSTSVHIIAWMFSDYYTSPCLVEPATRCERCSCWHFTGRANNTRKTSEMTPMNTNLQLSKSICN